jgi:hypothetical protein
MAFFAYNKLLDKVDDGPFATAADAPVPINEKGCSNHHDDEGIVILEYPDFDSTKDYVNCIRINSAGTALENPERDKSFEDQRKSDEAYRDLMAMKSIRVLLRNAIRSECGNLIKETEWEDVRAADLDSVNGNNAATTALYQKRQRMRDQSNTAEQALLALTDLDEVKAFKTQSRYWYTP